MLHLHQPLLRVSMRVSRVENRSLYVLFPCSVHGKPRLCPGISMLSCCGPDPTCLLSSSAFKFMNRAQPQLRTGNTRTTSSRSVSTINLHLHFALPAVTHTPHQYTRNGQCLLVWKSPASTAIRWRSGFERATTIDGYRRPSLASVAWHEWIVMTELGI